MKTNLITLKSWFKTKLKPTQYQFWDWMDSFWHKDEKIPLEQIENFEIVYEEVNKIIQDQKQDLTPYYTSTQVDDLFKTSLKYTDLVNDLITGGTTVPASAETVKTLKNHIDSIHIILASDDMSIDNLQEIVNFIKSIDFELDNLLVNDLTSGGTTKALTAEQGRELKQLITNLEAMLSVGLSNKILQKTTNIVDSDRILLFDSSDENKTKFNLFSQVKTSLKQYFDSLYNVPQIIIDTTVSIDINTLSNGLSQKGRNVIIANGNNPINYTVNSYNGFVASYVKHGAGYITFVPGTGRTLIPVDNTTILNGAVGSTASLTSIDTIDYLRISNA